MSKAKRPQLIELQLIEDLPFVGDHVLFFEQADTLSEPKAALITGFVQPGVYDLLVFPPKSNGGIARRNVHHVDSDELANNPEVKRNFGGWDTIDSAKSRLMDKRERELRVIEDRNERQRERRERLENPSDEEIEMILKCKEKNMAPQEIAEKMGAPWSADAVLALLRGKSMIPA